MKNNLREKRREILESLMIKAIFAFKSNNCSGFNLTDKKVLEDINQALDEIESSDRGEKEVK